MEIDIGKLKASLSDPERLRAFRQSRVQALGADGQQIARAAWKDRIEQIHIKDRVAKAAKRKFDGLVSRAMKASGEGQCMVLHAETGAGKTHLLNQLLKRPDLAASRDDFGPVRPLLYVRAPSPCNLLTLGRVLYKRLTDADLPQSYKKEEVWLRLSYQLYGQRVCVLVIDEFHHVLVNSSVEKKKSVVNTIKSLVQPDPMADFVPTLITPYPMQVVLAGVPLVNDVVRMDGELSRRTPRVAILPLPPTEEGLAGMKAFLAAVESLLGFPGRSGLSDDDMVRRFMAAARGYRGRAMHLVKEAAFLAIDKGAACIDRKRHLAAVFQEITELGPNANPFLVADISACPEVKENVWGKLTLLRGTRVDDADADPDQYVEED